MSRVDDREVHSSRVAVQQEESSSVGGGTGGSATDSEDLDHQNLFDYLADADFVMEHDISVSSDLLPRRRTHSLRVKHYTENGDEVEENATTKPAGPSRPNSVEGSGSNSSMNSSLNVLNLSNSQRGARVTRMKRYQNRPSTISDGTETDSADDPQNDCHERNSSGGVSSTDIWMANISQEDMNSSESDSVSMEVENNVNEDKDGQEGGLEVGNDDSPGENDSVPMEPENGVNEDKNGQEGDLEVVNEDSSDEGSLFRNGNQRAQGRVTERQAQAAALASAAVLHRNSLKKTSDVPFSNGTPETSEADAIARRNRVLEERRRKLENIAVGGDARSMPPDEDKISRHKAPIQDGNPRTINYDVYTGELIGKMPKISRLLRQSAGDEDSDSGSENTATDYDVPMSKRYRTRVAILIVILFILALCIFLGVYFGTNSNSDDDSSRAVGGANSGTRPSLRPTVSEPITSPSTQAPTIAITTGQSDELITETQEPSNGSLTSSPSKSPSSTAGVPASIDQMLLNVLLEDWPRVNEALEQDTSPQRLSLEWLSSSEDLTSFSRQKIHQRHALATIFFSTEGESWIRNDNWLSTEDECMWFQSGSEVKCDNSGALTTLKLNRNNLSGTLPAEIGLLTKLQNLDMIADVGDSLLYGDIPSEIGLLESLDFLNLSGNKLYGTIPTEIGFITNLRRLQLQQNEITGRIPSEIGRLLLLRHVDLRDNQMTGTIPSALGNLILLPRLFLSGNQLSGIIPSELGELVLMRELFLHNNRFTGEIPETFRFFGQLGNLRLESNNLVGTIPESICSAFADSTPLFVMDCEVDCPCCSHCCSDEGGCECQVSGTFADVLCARFP